MCKDNLSSFTYDELVDLAKLYSSYVISKANESKSYADHVLFRIGVSAFFDINILNASVTAVECVYRVSTSLERDETLIPKLRSLNAEQLKDFLHAYDCYIIGLDEERTCDSVPVCLAEFCECDLPEYANELMLERLDAQYAVFESALMAEGTEAMRSKNFALLSLVECFVRGYADASYEELADVATLVRDDSLIPTLLDWADGRIIPLTLEPDYFDDLFRQFNSYVVEKAQDSQS